MAAARLRDVAERAGVSIRTVSNVVNGYAPVSEPKRVRVEAAVAELGYRPNVMARNLKHGRSGLIALVVPELDVPYFAELARAVVTTAREFGYTVVVDQTDGESDRERELIMRDGSAAMFDGVILSPLALSQADLAQRDAASPLVLLGERIADSEYDHVAIDNVAAARLATSHLIGLGRTRIAAIGDQPYETGETAQLRTRGFELAHEDAGRAVDRVVSSSRRRGSTSPMGPRRLKHCSRTRTVRRMRSSATTTWSRSARSARSWPQGSACPRTSRSSDSTTSRPVGTHTPSLTTVAPDKPAIARLAVERLLARLGRVRRRKRRSSSGPATS